MPLIMHQVVNMRTNNRCYNSYRLTDVSKEYLQNYHGFYSTNMETCELVDSYKKIGQVTDYYDYKGLNFTHQRSQVMVFFLHPLEKLLINLEKTMKNLQT